MGLIQINKNPPIKELRWFAGLWLPLPFLILGLAAGLKGGHWSVVLPVWGAVAIVGLIGLVKPAWMRPIYLGWIYAVFPIGWVVSHTILALVYFVVMTLVGFLMRMTGYDPMHRKIDKAAKSYWIGHEKSSTSRRQYFRQF